MTLRHPVLSTLFGISDAMKGRDDIFMCVWTGRANWYEKRIPDMGGIISGILLI